jgi:hypothetical protein
MEDVNLYGFASTKRERKFAESHSFTSVAGAGSTYQNESFLAFAVDLRIKKY